MEGLPYSSPTSAGLPRFRSRRGNSFTLQSEPPPPLYCRQPVFLYNGSKDIEVTFRNVNSITMYDVFDALVRYYHAPLGTFSVYLTSLTFNKTFVDKFVPYRQNKFQAVLMPPCGLGPGCHGPTYITGRRKSRIENHLMLDHFWRTDGSRIFPTSRILMQSDEVIDIVKIKVAIRLCARCSLPNAPVARTTTEKLCGQVVA
jgi:hypothetical protein